MLVGHVGRPDSVSCESPARAGGHPAPERHHYIVDELPDVRVQPAAHRALSQRGSLRDTVPPHGQLILAHVSAGGEIVGWGGELDSLSANQTMVIELLGGIGYFHNYTRYAGLSGIVAVSSGRPLGAGALLHLGPGLRGGAVWRREAGATRTSALLSFDLYGLFDRSKKSVEDGYNAARSLVLLTAPSR